MDHQASPCNTIVLVNLDTQKFSYNLLGKVGKCKTYSLVAQMVKNLPAMQETRVQSLGWEDPLEESLTIHSSILVWRIHMDRGAWRATVHGVAKSWT